MARIRYVDKTFRPATLQVIRQANRICAAYAAQGLTLTLRQLYYQFVARDVFPDERRWAWTGTRWVRDPGGTKNADPNYKWLGEICNAARMAGLMDWNYLVDRTRNLAALPHWADPTDIVAAVARQYRTDRWADQSHRCEVWIEKDAGIGVIEGVCQRNDVPFFSCRGYTSVSEIWTGAQRLRSYLEGGQDVVVLHIGDHDPSGLDMSRDIEARLRLFISSDQQRLIVEQVVALLGAALEPGADLNNRWRALDAAEQQRWLDKASNAVGADRWGQLSIRRIALNYDQVLEHQPPPNPAKTTDVRFNRYVDETGLDESWELDALDPVVLQDLIQEAIDELRDQDRWDRTTEQMEAQRALLTQAADRWSDVAEFLGQERGA